MRDRFPVGTVIDLTVSCADGDGQFTYRNVTVTGTDDIGIAFYDPETDRESGITWADKPWIDHQYEDEQ